MENNIDSSVNIRVDEPDWDSLVTFRGFENRWSAEALQDGNVCHITGIGNSMTPVLASRQPVICEPVTEETEVKKKDIVLAKVNGHYYLHYVHAIRPGGQYLIGNAHGHMNGWVSKSKVFGRVVKIL